MFVSIGVQLCPADWRAMLTPSGGSMEVVPVVNRGTRAASGDRSDIRRGGKSRVRVLRSGGCLRARLRAVVRRRQHRLSDSLTVVS